MGRIPTRRNPNPWKEEPSNKKKVRTGSTAMTRDLTGRNYQRKCYVRDLCVDWQQKYGRKLRPVCPELKKWVNEEKLSDMANIQKTNSTMLDSINRILLVFGRLIQWAPTEKVITWCAHRKNILEECLSFVEHDLSLLPKRLESSYPDTSRRCDQLIAQLHIDRFRYKFHHPQSFLYLMPPDSARSHYFLILDWRQMQACGLGELSSELIEMNRLTSPYPAEAVKTMDKMYQELKPLAQIITEKQTKTGQRFKKTKKTKKIKKVKKIFKPWTNSGDACFIVEHNRIKFHFKDEIKNLKLRSESSTHRLLLLIRGGSLRPDEIKAEICPNTTNKASKVVDYANKLLNEKIAEVGFVGLPPNVEFIERDKYGHYSASQKIYEKEEFENMQFQSN